MDLKRLFFHRLPLREKQFTGENGGNALIRIPEKAEFDLMNDVFISGNTSIKMTVSCQKNPYKNFEEIDREANRNLEVLPVKKLRKDAIVHLLPGSRGYKVSIYNKRKDQAITITFGPEDEKNFEMLREIIKTAKFI